MMRRIQYQDGQLVNLRFRPEQIHKKQNDWDRSNLPNCSYSKFSRGPSSKLSLCHYQRTTVWISTMQIAIKHPNPVPCKLDDEFDDSKINSVTRIWERGKEV
jgi:hypothetical protein